MTPENLNSSNGTVATEGTFECAAVRLRGVRKRFDSGVEAIGGVDLSVAPAEFVSVVGASGCGKSTLLRIIAGLVPSTDGTVEVHGEPVVAPRRNVGMMFQRPALLAWKTSLENVLIPVRMRHKVQISDLEDAMQLLELFHLSGF